MDKESRSGSMDHAMRVSGRTEKQMVTESSTMRTATSMKVIGSTTRLTEMELIRMQMEQSMLVSGAMINNMDSDWRHGPTVQSTRAHTLKERRTEREN